MTTATPTNTPIAAPRLWAVHLKGVDQVIAMLDFDAATKWADDTNTEWARQSARHQQTIPGFEAVVVHSPWAGEEHYRNCAQILTQVMQAGDAMLNNLRHQAARLHADAIRYYFHRDVSLNPALEETLQPVMSFVDELDEPKNATEYDALMDRCIQAARQATLWPPAAPEAPAVEVAA
jgi:hypothetical protein